MLPGNGRFFFLTLLPVLSGYLVLGQTFRYQHYEFFKKKEKEIYISNSGD
jgi:hypothetical protein